MLQSIGIALLIVGFLGGALVSVLQPEAIHWPLYFVFALIAGAGIGLIRWASRQLVQDKTVLAGKIEDIHSSLDLLCAEAANLEEGFVETSVYQLPEVIDAKFPVPISRFVEARLAIAEIHGTQAYADIMGEFAAGERYLNRVWSASAEGYVDEASAYIKRARRQFERTRNALGNLK